METRSQPAEWASKREAEGWLGIAVPDHVFIEKQAVAHLWVTATEMALATKKVTIATSFANNLLRSPVEFAQGSLALQRASNGRFEAGLGAGWDQDELEATGVNFPLEAQERAGRYIEAGKIVRQLFDEGSADFSGRWYRVKMDTIGPQVEDRPPLVVSVGGPRTTKALTPVADVVEVKLPGFATTGKGSFHTRSLSTVSLQDIEARMDEVRGIRPDARLGLFLAAGCCNDAVVGTLRKRLQGSLFASLFGPADEVAETIHKISALGFERLTIGAVTPKTYQQLAPSLLTH